MERGRGSHPCRWHRTGSALWNRFSEDRAYFPSKSRPISVKGKSHCAMRRDSAGSFRTRRGSSFKGSLSAVYAGGAQRIFTLKSLIDSLDCGTWRRMCRLKSAKRISPKAPSRSNALEFGMGAKLIPDQAHKGGTSRSVQLRPGSLCRSVLWLGAILLAAACVQAQQAAPATPASGEPREAYTAPLRAPTEQCMRERGSR